MQKKSIYTLGFLVALTLITALFSNSKGSLFYITAAIMVLSGIKFTLVTFDFMELKKANIFWKIMLISFLIVFITIVLIVKL